MIACPLEGSLTVMLRARSDADEARLRGWIEADPELLEIVVLAAKIRDRRAAA